MRTRRLTAVIIAFIAGLCAACDGSYDVDVVNKTEMPLVVAVNFDPQDRGTYFNRWHRAEVKPLSTRQFSIVTGGSYPQHKDRGPAVIATGPTGGQIFCVTYTWYDLAQVNYRLNITYDPQSCK